MFVQKISCSCVCHDTQFSCTSSGVEIILEGIPILCSCEGEEVRDEVVVAFTYVDI